MKLAGSKKGMEKKEDQLRRGRGSVGGAKRGWGKYNTNTLYTQEYDNERHYYTVM